MVNTAEHLDRIVIKFGGTSDQQRKIINLRNALFASGNQTNVRRSGNTTRQVDIAIRELFQGNIVVCFDHYQGGMNKLSNLSLLDLVMKRLVMEHQGVGFQADRTLFTIYLK